MRRWRAVIRLTIMLGRLSDHHHMISDDSYNIRFARGKGEAAIAKPEVLFDVTDYKTKNQMRLSESCRKVLSVSSEERTEQDLRLVYPIFMYSLFVRYFIYCCDLIKIKHFPSIVGTDCIT